MSDYRRIEAERTQQLARLWDSWEEAQADADKLSNELDKLLECEPPNGTSGISSNCEWPDREEFDIDLRIKKVVDDMAACEEVSPSLKPDPTLSGSLKS